MKSQAYWVTTYQLQVVSPWAYSSTLRPAFLCHIQFFPPHKIVTMETLISRLQKPVDDIIVATSKRWTHIDIMKINFHLLDI